MNAPYLDVTIDIETIAGRPEEAEAWARRYWSPSRNWKDTTVGTRWREAVEKKEARLALIDDSPIVVVSLATDRDCRVLHTLASGPTGQVNGAQVEAFASERDMLAALRDYLDANCDPETVIVSHNGKRFDWPRLRLAYTRAGLRIPVALIDRNQPRFDTMIEFSRFTVEDRPFISLGDVCDILNIPHHKDLLDGADVAELYSRGRYGELVAYALADVLVEREVYRTLAGIRDDREVSIAIAPTGAELADFEPLLDDDEPPAPASQPPAPTKTPFF
jgi:hypothetical protein